VTTIEYLIDPARTDAFVAVMEQTRRVRLSEGAIGWALLHDIAEPARFVEQITDESWTEHLRRFHRATAADIALRERRLAFHQGAEPPVVTRFVARR
jgi:quinol monooxygenase YgiN